MQDELDGDVSGPPSFENFPLTRPEYISAIVHFYRGEMYRSQVWRMRLDTTTNWSVVTVAGMISFAFSSPDHSAFTVLLANLLVTTFLSIEARRYRYFCVYRARVRMIEENFYLPLIRRSLVSPKGNWSEVIARDLDEPKFKTTIVEAMLFRLRQNYAALYGIVLVTWLVKLLVHPVEAASLSEVYRRAGIGPVPASLVFGLVAVFYLGIGVLLLSPLSRRAAADEIRGVERERSHWKV